MNDARKVAYFSMEIAVDSAIPTYAGGLGILAGDTIRSAADLRVPTVAVTLIHRKGYFHQRLDADGVQREEPAEWDVAKYCTQMPARVEVIIESRPVKLRAWKYEVTGIGDYKVPVYFLDSDLPENSEWDRTITHFLYGGDQHYRLCQEIVLGIGGMRMLNALGYTGIERLHMNEGHASLLALELLDEEARNAGRDRITLDDISAVRRRCVFTTHTPVPAGHDQFPLDLVERVLGHRAVFEMQEVFCCEGVLNMTFLALNLSHYVNGVAKSHGEVARLMFAHYTIDSITNGVHAGTWTSPPFQTLYDHHITGWRQDNFSLRYAMSIPRAEIWHAHATAKEQLISFVNTQANCSMDANVLTLGFARRAAAYKRADMLFSNLERLRAIAAKVGPLQIIYAGKAHPQDSGGKELIRRVFQAKESLGTDIKVAYLENYDMEMGRLLTAGSDLLAKYSSAAYGSFRHQRYESGAQWRAQSQCPRWLVDRGMHR